MSRTWRGDPGAASPTTSATSTSVADFPSTTSSTTTSRPRSAISTAPHGSRCRRQRRAGPGPELGEDIEILTEPGRAMTSDAACADPRRGHKMRGETRLALPGHRLQRHPGIRFRLVLPHGDRQPGVGRDDGRFRVVGPLCDSIDVFFDMEGEPGRPLLAAEPALAVHADLLRRKLVHMPPYRELQASTQPGDVIALLDVGAYQVEMANHYCGRLRPAAVMSGRAATSGSSAAATRSTTSSRTRRSPSDESPSGAISPRGWGNPSRESPFHLDPLLFRHYKL